MFTSTYYPVIAVALVNSKHSGLWSTEVRPVPGNKTRWTHQRVFPVAYPVLQRMKQRFLRDFTWLEMSVWVKTWHTILKPFYYSLYFMRRNRRGVICLQILGRRGTPLLSNVLKIICFSDANVRMFCNIGFLLTKYREAIFQLIFYTFHKKKTDFLPPQVSTSTLDTLIRRFIRQ